MGGSGWHEPMQASHFVPASQGLVSGFDSSATSFRVIASIDVSESSPSRLLTDSNDDGIPSSQNMFPSSGGCSERMVTRRSSIFRRPGHGYGYRQNWRKLATI